MAEYETTIEVRWPGEVEPVELELMIDMDLTQHPIAPSGVPHLGTYDPGCGCEWDFSVCRIILPNRKDAQGVEHTVQDIGLTWYQFCALFGENLSSEVWENACDWADDNYDPGDYE